MSMTKLLVMESLGQLVYLIEATEDKSETVLKRIVQKLAQKNEVPHQVALMSLTSDHTAAEWLESIYSELKPAEWILQKRILAVDDDEILLASIKRILNKHIPNVQVEVTTDGYEACILYPTYKPDLLLLDVKMPEFDGFKILQAIKEVQNDSEAKVLTISGHADELKKTLYKGANETLMKPFEPSELIGKITTLLRN